MLSSNKACKSRNQTDCGFHFSEEISVNFECCVRISTTTYTYAKYESKNVCQFKCYIVNASQIAKFAQLHKAHNKFPL